MGFSNLEDKNLLNLDFRIEKIKLHRRMMTSISSYVLSNIAIDDLRLKLRLEIVLDQ